VKTLKSDAKSSDGRGMAQCPHCGAATVPGDHYCGSCRAPLHPVGPPGAAPPGSRFGAPPPPPPFPMNPPSYLPPTGSAPGPFGAPVATLPRIADPFLPSSPPRRSGPPKWVTFLVPAVVVVALVAVGFVVVSRRSSRYPKQWDEQIAPIAARVAQLRGLSFKHPVKVEYLSAGDFQKQVTESPEDLKKEHEQIEQTAAVFRAAGLIGGNVDLGKAVNDTQAADVIALYDPDTKKILVRGTGPLTIETRVTLAHELTHVLQDQNFDLNKLYKAADDSKTGSSDALRALVEGDAVRIEHKYLAEQSATDRAAYEQLSDATSKSADDAAKNLPPVIQTYFGAPYIFGPQVVAILESDGGNRAIDDALTGPTPTTRIYLDPTAVNQVADTPPPVPLLHGDEKRLANETRQDENFDEFTLYLMLSARLDAREALRAADAYSAGSSTSYTTGGTTCFRASITGVNAASNGFLASALGDWAKRMPDAAVESTSGPLTFHSCDPGSRAVEPSKAAIDDATTLAATRGAITNTFISTNHIPADTAACVARLIMQLPNAGAVIRPTTPAELGAAQRAGFETGQACRENPLAGIP